MRACIAANLNGSEGLKKEGDQIGSPLTRDGAPLDLSRKTVSIYTHELSLLGITLYGTTIYNNIRYVGITSI